MKKCYYCGAPCGLLINAFGMSCCLEHGGEPLGQTFAIDPYECESCAARPGSPILCADCLRRREELGEAWIGPRPPPVTLESIQTIMRDLAIKPGNLYPKLPASFDDDLSAADSFIWGLLA